MKRYVIALLGAGGLVFGLGVTAASASPRITPADSTTGCEAVWVTSCATPVVAQSAIGAADLIPEADFGMTVDTANPNAPAAYDPVELSFNNNLLDGSQDFAWDLVGHVTPTGAGTGEYGFTGFDRFNFGTDPLYEIRYVPNGIDSDLCVTVSSKFRHLGLVLGDCVSAAQQVWIVTQGAPTNGKSVPGLADLIGKTGRYYYALEASHATTDAQQHNFLLAPHPSVNGSLLAAGTPVHAAAGVASLDEWASIP